MLFEVNSQFIGRFNHMFFQVSYDLCKRSFSTVVSLYRPYFAKSSHVRSFEVWLLKHVHKARRLSNFCVDVTSVSVVSQRRTSSIEDNWRADSAAVLEDAKDRSMNYECLII